MGEMDDIIDLVSLSNDDLKRAIKSLEAEERELSRQRRILHGRLDILRAELVLRLQKDHQEGRSLISGDDVTLLSRILAGKGIADQADLDDEAEDTDEGSPTEG